MANEREELAELVSCAQSGDVGAFETIVQRFQDMAIGYGYLLLSDLAQAEDAAQEAFIAAYYGLHGLRDAKAFPSWFRRIVATYALRQKRVPHISRNAMSLSEADDVPSCEPQPREIAESRETRTEVMDAIRSLPARQRDAVMLFYFGDCSLLEISAFLDVPVATVKTRLYAARKQLKERVRINMGMTKGNLPKGRPSRNEEFTERVMNLLKAAREGDAARVSGMLKLDAALANANGLEWSDCWHGNASPLHVAVMNRRKDIVDLLLAHGADINERSAANWSVLHHAIDVEYSDYVEGYSAKDMIAFLVSRGAKNDIFVSLWMGDSEGVEAWLQEHPEDVNATGPMRATPLCFVYTEAMAKLLLDHGADPLRKINDSWCIDKHVDTPIRWAASRDANILTYLLKRAGIPTDDIWITCAMGDVAKAKAMLNANSQLVNARSPKDHVLLGDATPVHVAARYRQQDIAKLLLDRGADMNARTSGYKGMTPLHLAVWLSLGDENFVHLEIPRLLLKHGADTDARDTERNWTALEWCEARHMDEEKDRSGAAKLLREFGAK